jgi:hypothetical protein
VIVTKVLVSHSRSMSFGSMSFGSTSSRSISPRSFSAVRRAVGLLREGGLAALSRGLNRRYYRYRSRASSGYDLLGADWDVCVVLDACRYDLFAERSSLPGTLSRATSRGSSTTEWLAATIDGRDARDPVYVTANPQLYDNRDAIAASFHAVEAAWRDGWDPNRKTVPPERTTERALAAAETYPHKRLLIHYLQPHYPFLTAAGDWHERGHAREDGSFWDDVFRCDLTVDRDLVWRRYAENLEAVLPHVRELIESIEGKVVVTADHGNMVGERAWPIPVREWGHPPAIHTAELLTVPWLECPYEERRDVVCGEDAGVAAATAGDPGDVVEDRLADLGYAP